MSQKDIDWSKLPELSRRNFILAGGAGAAGLLLAACGSAGTSGGGPSGAGTKNALGATLPSGAAPAGAQFYVQPFDSTGASYKALDFYETVYSRAPLADNFNFGLVRLDQNFNIQPAMATSWQQSSDGLSWTFKIRPGVMWSDGREVTAADYVETLRYSADPKHAWDFTWYWSGVIKNYTEAAAGSMPVESIGVSQGADKYTVVFQTEGPIAFMPFACLYTQVMSAAALNKYGSGVYNIDPSTVVTCGPYTLTKFDPTAEIIEGPNKKYTGPFKPYIQNAVAKIYAGGDMLPRFETGEIDTIGVTPLDLKVAAKNSKMKNLHLYKNANDFEIQYAFFDVTKEPWNNLKVRQAFAHSVDRDTIIKSLLAPLAIPAYGYLMPGFPFAVTDPLKPLTNYDPKKAQSLLADAGYPGGKGFPQVTFNWWQFAQGNFESVVQALTANWNKVLGVNIQLQELDKTTFYHRMNAKPTQISMGFVQYGMDYFDASNMLSVYKGGGRHNWNNAQYDALLAQGAAESDKAKRQQIYTQAQTLLTEQAPAIFVFHLLYGYYYQSFIQGSALAKEKYGYDGIQWPGFTPFSTSLEQLFVNSGVSKSGRQSVSGLGS
ncbi:MAG: peptide ABC transporter substrate-binding protein [Candidatus Dormibacteraeota bacterium]|nr:peptide ABC transporter substrate-binding protein [Candidatus Dormibacteraeota bacterium]